MPDPALRRVTRLRAPARGLLIVIALVLAGWALHAMTSVVVPIVFALLIALIVAPSDSAIAAHLPERTRWVGHLGVMLALLLVLAAFTLGLVYCAEQLLARMPAPEQLQHTLSRRLASGEETTGGARLPPWLIDLVGRSGDTLGDWLASTAADLLRRVAGAAGTMIAGTLLVVFLALLVLVEAKTWSAKVDALWGDRSGTMRSMLRVTAAKLRRWLLARAAIGLLSAACYVIWLWAFGVDLLGVWALLTFLLVFIPNIGAVISGTLPVIYVLATREIATALWVGAGLFVIENAIGNWVDPRLQGRQIAVSPVVIFVSLMVWSWIWGVAGAFLATPVTVVTMVICAHVVPLRNIALLLSDQSDLDALDRRMAT